eukprot:scaffold59438_cov59-Phaeocystis_antarctica.AAC.2
MNHEQKWFNNFEAIRFGDAVWETERGAFHCSVRRLHPLAIFVIAFAINFDFFDQLHDRLPCSSCFRATFLFFESPLTVAHLNSAFANALVVCVWGGSGVGEGRGHVRGFRGQLRVANLQMERFSIRAFTLKPRTWRPPAL